MDDGPVEPRADPHHMADVVVQEGVDRQKRREERQRREQERESGNDIYARF